MSSPIWMGDEEQIERMVAEMQRKAERANAFDIQKGGIMSLPFRQTVFWLGRWGTAVKKAFTNSGLLKFHIKGQNFAWKLEHRAAWALDEGQALDKLVKIKIR